MFKDSVLIALFAVILFHAAYYYLISFKSKVDVKLDRDPQIAGLRVLQLFVTFFGSSTAFNLFLSENKPTFSEMLLFFLVLGVIYLPVQKANKLLEK